MLQYLCILLLGQGLEGKSFGRFSFKDLHQEHIHFLYGLTFWFKLWLVRPIELCVCLFLTVVWLNALLVIGQKKIGIQGSDKEAMSWGGVHGDVRKINIVIYWYVCAGYENLQNQALCSSSFNCVHVCEEGSWTARDTFVNADSQSVLQNYWSVLFWELFWVWRFAPVRSISFFRCSFQFNVWYINFTIPVQNVILIFALKALPLSIARASVPQKLQHLKLLVSWLCQGFDLSFLHPTLNKVNFSLTWCDF